MTTTWNDLASSARWRGIVSFIRKWLGPLKSHDGISPEELDAALGVNHLNLPATVREWYLLVGNWSHWAPSVWIRPEELTQCDGMVCVLSDTDGIVDRGIRVEDLHIENPPVIATTDGFGKPTNFLEFVVAAVMNNVIFAYEPPVQLRQAFPQLTNMHHIASCNGDFFADGPLESAAVVVYVYQNTREVYGHARTRAGQRLLHRYRLNR